MQENEPNVDLKVKVTGGMETRIIKGSTYLFIYELLFSCQLLSQVDC